MGFYYNGERLDTLVISGNFSIGTTTRPTIDIINGEAFSVDVSGVQVVNGSQRMQTVKISVQLGNQEPIIVAAPIEKPINPNIKFLEEQDEFRIVELKGFFKEGETSGTLVIKVFDPSGNAAVINVPYNVMFLSISDYGSDFDLVQANITNTNDVSYVLRQRETDSVLFVSS